MTKNEIQLDVKNRLRLFGPVKELDPAVKCPDCGSHDLTRLTPYDYRCNTCRRTFKAGV